jgi:hypothetical protein
MRKRKPTPVPRFIRAGNSVLNLDQIIKVVPNAGQTDIVMSNGETITIAKDPLVVLDYLLGRGLAIDP